MNRAGATLILPATARLQVFNFRAEVMVELTVQMQVQEEIASFIPYVKQIFPGQTVLSMKGAVQLIFCFDERQIIYI